MVFDKALAFTLSWEGYTFTDDPDDPGGVTKYGISFRFIQDLPLRLADTDGDGEKTWRDILSLDHQEAKQIYHDFFWSPLLLDILPERLSVALFDTAVNCGRSRTVKWMQEIVGEKRDGLMGPKTMAAVFRLICPDAPINSELALAKALIALRINHYLMLAINNEWAMKYINGWTNRADDLKLLIEYKWEEEP